MLHPIIGTHSSNRVADIVFVHGINPFGVVNSTHAFTTWGGSGRNSNFWPKWLGEDLAALGLPVGVWILEYDAAAIGWMGTGMPIIDRAANVLDTFYGEGIGDRPIIFVAHSMGGLVVKQILNRSATINNDTESAIASATRGVIFLATPHTGADLASFVVALGKALRQTEALKDLAANAAPLREQSAWYINSSAQLGIRTRSYYETKPTLGLGLVVDQASANPNIAHAPAVPIDADHNSISQIQSKELPQYKSIRRFIQETLKENPL